MKQFVIGRMYLPTLTSNAPVYVPNHFLSKLCFYRKKVSEISQFPQINNTIRPPKQFKLRLRFNHGANICSTGLTVIQDYN